MQEVSSAGHARIKQLRSDSREKPCTSFRQIEPVLETHFTRRDKAQPLIDEAPFVRRMQNEPVETLRARPVDDPLQHERGHPSSPPFPLGKDVDDDGVAPFGNRDLVTRFGGRMWQDAAQLNAGSGDDLVRKSFRSREPPDIFAGLKHLPQPDFAPRAVGIEEPIGQQSHLPEHPGAMKRNDFDIGEANLKTRRRHEPELLLLARGRNRPHAERGTQVWDETFGKLDGVAGRRCDHSGQVKFASSGKSWK